MILYLGAKIDHKPQGGRALLSKLNYDALCEINGDLIRLFELEGKAPVGIKAKVNSFRGYIDGLDGDSIGKAVSLIKSEKIEKVFIDGSNLGEFAAVLKRKCPQVEVVVFFHNVEARFFWGSFRLHKSIRALAVLLVNTLAERKAIKFSDKRICLSERDSRLLVQLYGRGATHIAPMALEDKCPTSFVKTSAQAPERFALFVGGTFYANKAGIAWFVREVVPRIDLPIYIVGKGFEALRGELEIPGKVIVVGAVDSLDDWYHRAQFVIAPIFDGSGMKTKVAEALMYGKKIVGTSEAFTGYEDVADRAGHICKSADDFVSAINIAKGTFVKPFDPELRAIYQEKYAYPAARSRLAEIMG